MKILLLGDYSSLHLNLYKGLKFLKNDVELASNGDYDRNIFRTYDLQPHKAYKNRLLDGVSRLKLEYDFVNALGDYDVIQIINAGVLSAYHLFDLYLKLRKKAKKLILISAGIDKAYLNNRPKYFDYYYDFNDQRSKWAVKKEDHLLSIIDGVITTSYTYKKVYEENPKFIENIPFPIIIDPKVKFLENKKNLLFHHGNSKSRYLEKGSNFIQASFDHLGKIHQGTHQFVFTNQIPYDNYLKLLNDKIDCVVDQTYGYDPGINALISMAKGKIVFGGCEKSYMKSIPIDKAPLINIKPSEKHITCQIESFLDDLSDLNNRSKEAHSFVVDHHDHIKIAEKYLKIWKMI